MEPVRRLLASDTFTNALDAALKLPTSMRPVKPLPSKYRDVRFGSAHNALGMGCDRKARGR
jgi:hypothetical protein